MIRSRLPLYQEFVPLLSMLRTARRFSGPLSVLLVIGAAPLAAQSIVAGALQGVVADTSGRPLNQTDVTLRNRATGFAHTVTTDRDGHFRIALVPPGVYDAYVERLGFRPLLIVGVTIAPGTSRDAAYSLEEAAPPVTTVDTSTFDATTQLAGVAPFRWVEGQDLVALADPLHRMGAAGALFAPLGGSLGFTGLPGRLGGVSVDGVPHASARHPLAADGALDGTVFPLEAMSRIAPVLGGTDAEWPGLGGGVLDGSTIGGSRALHARAGADLGDGDRRGTFLVTGPIVADTVVFAFGFTAQRVERASDAPWQADALTSAVDTIARDSLGHDLGAYLRPYRSRTDVVSGFGRFDWQLSGSNALTLRANFGRLVADNEPVAAGAPVTLGSRLTVREWSGLAALTTVLSRRVSSEFRFGLDGSDREYAADTAGITTTFADGGLAAGEGAAWPARFQRTTVRATEALHARYGTHALKLGLALRYDTHERTWSADRAGAFAFGGATEMLERRGMFQQAVGLLPVAAFSTREVAWALQDVWMPAPGLQLTVAVRASHAQLPRGDVRRSTEWLRLTGVDNTLTPRQAWRLDPRAALQWWVGPAGDWVLRGEVGRYTDETDPAVLAEVRIHDGGVVMRRGFGLLGAWPETPDTAAAPSQGPALVLLHGGFEAPRTSRAALSLRRTLGAGAALYLGGAYRHTDFLPRRRDLNLRSTSGLTDQDGRSIAGTLRQEGSLIGAVPGSSRRFGDFDMVSAIEASGYSDYVDATVALERVVPRGVSLWASYTWSRTRDNWIGAGSADPAALYAPFADLPGATDWTVGRSDFDVPHRGVAGAELRVPGRLGFRFAALFRYRSGTPFTPGFRAGVDVNGDGVAGNDPAYVTDVLPGDTAGVAAGIVAANACLRSQVGQFAERNSCRGPAQGGLDLRLAVALFHVAGRASEVVFDAVNVVTTESGVVDRALYLVDRNAALSTSAAGVVTLPLVANPGFGRLLVRRTPPSLVRAGLRVAF